MKVDNAEPIRRNRSAEEVLASVRGKDGPSDQPKTRASTVDKSLPRRSRREAVKVSTRMARLLDEARWLLMGCGALFLMMVLATYSKTDPSWSHASTLSQVHNWGGKVGAWLSDLILYLFGASAWLWCLPLTKGIHRSYRAFALKFMVKVTPKNDYEPEPIHRFDKVLGGLGFVMVFLGCDGLEFVRLYSHKIPLPHVPGGILGELFGGAAQVQFGFNGSTMLFLVLITMGLSFYYRFSWLSVAERVGEMIERGVAYVDGLYGSISERRAAQEIAQEAPSVAPPVPASAQVVAAPAKSRAEMVEPVARVEPTVRIEQAARIEPHLGAIDEIDDAQTVQAQRGVAERAAANPVWRHAPTRANVDDDVAPAQVAPAPVVIPPAVPVAAPPSLQVVRPVTAPVSVTPPEDAPAEVQPRAAAVRTVQPPAPAPAQASVAVVPPSRPSLVIVPAEKAIKQKVVMRSGDSELPPLDLLDEAPVSQETVSGDTLEFTSRMIEKKLSDFGVEATVVAAYPGPVITRYEIEPAVGVKGSQIVNLARDLARAFAVTSIRVVETIPGKNYMGLELPNPKRQIVRLTEIIGSQVYHDNASKLTVALGKDSSGKPMVADLAKMPHLLVAGTTGSGKSVGINATILSLLYKADPNEVRLILIDPKMLEMSIYEGIPHLLAPVVTDMRQASHALNWAVEEMERRYKLMSKMGVRNLAGFNAKIDDAAANEEKIPNPFSLTPDDPEPLEKLPMIVIIIDELADLMMVVGKKVEELIARIAQKARAAGIHLILATQRPSVDVITGLIKANIPTRIAFQVSSKIDSRTILDQMGAETLLGMGDMLYMPPGSGLPLRVHGAFVSDDEVHRVVEHLKAQGEPNYVEGILEGGVLEEGGGGGGGDGDGEEDPMYDQAVAVVLETKRASISLVQRHLRIGYNRAARLLEQMEHSGLVSPMKSNGNREIIAPNNQG